jgi:hypothetical protein
MSWTMTRHIRVDALSRAERLAVRLFPHRASLLAAGLGLFLLGALPLVRVAQGDLGLAQWHVVLFGVSVPLVLWALSLGFVAIFFHPVHGLVGGFDPGWSSRSTWLRSFLRAYATLTVWAFAIAPFVVLVAAAA